MRKKKIGILFGMEDTFPWALIEAINARGGDDVGGGIVEISYVKDDGVFPYDLILDRISHEVPFYRTYLKCAVASGVRVVNNPIWWSADDKFFDNLVAKRPTSQCRARCCCRTKSIRRTPTRSRSATCAS